MKVSTVDTRQSTRIIPIRMKSRNIKLPSRFSNIEKVLTPFIPLVNFCFLVIAFYSYSFYVIPHAFNVEGIWTPTSGYAGLFFINIALLMLAAYIRAIVVSPGHIPMAWKMWSGDDDTQPSIPLYAQVSKGFQKARTQPLIESLMKQCSSFKAPKTIRYSAFGPSECIPGVKVMPSDGPSPYENLQFKTMCTESEDEMHKSDGEGISIPLESVGELMKHVQWGGPVDENTKRRMMQNMVGNDGKVDLKMDLEKGKADNSYCGKDDCSNFRPPRSHHCKRCKQCVERMDHHCIWMNNCIGLGNHKAFFLFLVYFSINIVSYIILSLAVFYTHTEWNMLNVIFFISCFPVGYFIFQLLRIQFWNITNNVTELEKIINPPEIWLKYDTRSKLENAKFVLGKSVTEWIFPF